MEGGKSNPPGERRNIPRVRNKLLRGGLVFKHTITESKPGELVRMLMDWIRPMAAVATVDFTFKPDGDKTVVAWAMYGKNGFMGKAISLFMDCDKMCGPQFEQGLADLGKVVTAAPAAK